MTMTLVPSMKHTPSDPLSSCFLVNLMAVGGGQTESLGVIAPQSRCTQKEQKTLFFRCSEALTVSVCSLVFFKLLRTCPGEMKAVLN